MIAIKVELDQQVISQLLPDGQEADGVIFTANNGGELIGYGAFRVEDEVLYVHSCNCEDKEVLEGIVRAAISWALSLGAVKYDLSLVEQGTANCLYNKGFARKGNCCDIISHCKCKNSPINQS